MTGFSELSKRLNDLGVDQHAAELQGVLTGFVAAGGSPDRLDTLVDWLGLDGSESQRSLLLQLLQETGGQLADPELGFEPLLPNDEETLSVRGHAVSRWCAGFISGFGIGAADGGESGRDVDDEVREVLSDLQKIAAMTDDIPDSEENETDLTEIIEFVRVTALLVFASCALGGEEGDQ